MRRALGVVLLALLAAPLAAAHGGGAPLPGDSLARATDLGRVPARIFETVDAGEAHYHRIEIDGGTVRFRVLAPEGAAPAGTVTVVVFGPGLPEGAGPEGIEAPPGAGALVFIADDAAPLVDARVPARYHVLLDRTLELSVGQHHVVVHSTDGARLAIFFEPPDVSPLDWLNMQAVRTQARGWGDGSGVTTTAVSIAAAAVVGAVAWTQRRAGLWSFMAAAGTVAAALVAISTATYAADAWRVGAVSWPILGGGVAIVAGMLFASRPRGVPTWRFRAALLVLGLAAFATWHGYLWGPVIAVAAALVPEPEDARSSRGTR